MKLLKNKYFWTALSVLVVVLLVSTYMPKPIDMDLDKVGTGKPAVVFVYDLNLAVSNEQAMEMNKAQEILGDQAILLVTKAGDPTRETFRQRYAARSAELLFFDGAGRLLERRMALLSAQELADRLIN